MLTKHSKDQREQLEVVALSELVPEDHLVRKIEEAIDFSFIYQKVAPLEHNSDQSFPQRENRNDQLNGVSERRI